MINMVDALRFLAATGCIGVRLNHAGAIFDRIAFLWAVDLLPPAAQLFHTLHLVVAQ